MAKGKKKRKKKNRAATEAEGTPPLGTKLQYVGVGFVLGVASSPTVRKWIERARPEVDKLLERLTAHAEELAENAGDWMATARGHVAGGEAAKDDDSKPPSGHGHEHEH